MKLAVRKISLFSFAGMLFLCNVTISQTAKTNALIYVDNTGRIRWTKNKQEMYLFGVNYTLPFAYGYRSVKALGLDIENEIDKDVYHLSRMGVDAFRVHIWDTEITDTLGNLLDNDHLKMLDYLIYQLKQRNIKTIITPIAFWGNGYPEKDEHTAGFSSKYNKEQATINENAILAQENYIRQLLQHVNPYTKINYKDEQDIIAAELNNEPSHSGPKEGVTNYINRLAAAARNIGWDKPLFYNISQSPFYADAVAKSTVDGFSFQWYPSGLVAGREQKGNFLPNVDVYSIPFDTMPAFRNKAKMIYEFDAADLLQSYIYPAVARSFKQAGFQWVTQFAYDPLATAYGNTEYQTHYLNLAYTPAKAISFLIANRVFHQLPKNKLYGAYPVDSVFDAFRVSYAQGLSEMNTTNEYYYSSSTASVPTDNKKLEHIAGVGSSTIVKYGGYGTYFIDKLENGIWRLEVMPDAITIRDPFEKPSPAREVVHIQWQAQPMQIDLTDLGGDFDVKAINQDNIYQTAALDKKFTINPGTYLLIKKGISTTNWPNNKQFGNGRLNEFVAPNQLVASTDPFVVHTPFSEVTAGKPIIINAKIINIDTADKVSLVVNRAFGGPSTISMERLSAYDFRATIPAAQIVSGLLTYRIMIQKANKDFIIFPNSHKGNPYKWDYINNDNWQTFVASANGKLTLFNSAVDRGNNNIYFPGLGRNGGAVFTSGDETGKLVFRTSTPAIRKNQVMGLQLFIGDKLLGRVDDIKTFTKVIVRAKMHNGSPSKLRIAITTADAATYAAYVDLTDEFKNIDIPLTNFKADSSLLLPRPYPGFLPLWFKAGNFTGLNLEKMDKLEFTIGNILNPSQYNQPLGIDVEAIWLDK